MAVSANTRKGGWLETATIIIEALAIAMVVRTFLYQPFNIPSGSMKQTLLVGDCLFVSERASVVGRLPLRCNWFRGTHPIFFLHLHSLQRPHLGRRAEARRWRRVQ